MTKIGNVVDGAGTKIGELHSSGGYGGSLGLIGIGFALLLAVLYGLAEGLSMLARWVGGGAANVSAAVIGPVTAALSDLLSSYGVQIGVGALLIWLGGIAWQVLLARTSSGIAAVSDHSAEPLSALLSRSRSSSQVVPASKSKSKQRPEIQEESLNSLLERRPSRLL